MGDDLERDLGLYATVTISMGAMIGSGIFVLPALGLTKAGPAVVVAYVLAGLVVLPAALSKAEMATAMPESGGTYLYIDRAMGPLAGTVAGIGAWFSLVFKSAFALVGMGAFVRHRVHPGLFRRRLKRLERGEPLLVVLDPEVRDHRVPGRDHRLEGSGRAFARRKLNELHGARSWR